jgi:hypothetical protein
MGHCIVHAGATIHQKEEVTQAQPCVHRFVHAFVPGWKGLRVAPAVAPAAPHDRCCVLCNGDATSRQPAREAGFSRSQSDGGSGAHWPASPAAADLGVPGHRVQRASTGSTQEKVSLHRCTQMQTSQGRLSVTILHFWQNSRLCQLNDFLAEIKMTIKR